MNIVYIGDVGAEGTAMSVHAQNIASILSKLGHEVTFICSDPGFNNSRIEKKDYYYTNRYMNFPVLRSVEYRCESIFGIKLVIALKKVHRSKTVDLVILYGYSGENRIIGFCKKNGISIVADRVDWFENSDFTNTLYNKWFCKHIIDHSIIKTDQNLNGVIAISHFLEEHYKKMGIETLWMPPVFTRIECEKEISFSKPVKLVYAGSLGGSKDIIIPAIEAVKKINAQDVKIKLFLVGVSSEELNEQLDLTKHEKYGIYACGLVPHDKALEIIRNSDFGLLLRNNKRYAKAGFSTKFAECMSCGIPMICTKVGGADSVIEDATDGFLIDNNEIETLINLFSKIIGLPNKKIMQMKLAAYRKANILFNSDNYDKEINQFLAKVRRTGKTL